jgi:hypothetical protein
MQVTAVSSKSKNIAAVPRLCRIMKRGWKRMQEEGTRFRTCFTSKTTFTHCQNESSDSLYLQDEAEDDEDEDEASVDLNQMLPKSHQSSVSQLLREEFNRSRMLLCAFFNSHCFQQQQPRDCFFRLEEKKPKIIEVNSSRASVLHSRDKI